MQFVKVVKMKLKAGNDKLQETSDKLDVIKSSQQSLHKQIGSCCGNENKPQAKHELQTSWTAV